LLNIDIILFKYIYAVHHLHYDESPTLDCLLNVQCLNGQRKVTTHLNVSEKVWLIICKFYNSNLMANVVVSLVKLQVRRVFCGIKKQSNDHFPHFRHFYS
jgi:hypothetical protein